MSRCVERSWSLSLLLVGFLGSCEANPKRPCIANCHSRFELHDLMDAIQVGDSTWADLAYFNSPTQASLLSLDASGTLRQFSPIGTGAQFGVLRGPVGGVSTARCGGSEDKNSALAFYKAMDGDKDPGLYFCLGEDCIDDRVNPRRISRLEEVEGSPTDIHLFCENTQGALAVSTDVKMKGNTLHLFRGTIKDKSLNLTGCSHEYCTIARSTYFDRSKQVISGSLRTPETLEIAFATKDGGTIPQVKLWQYPRSDSEDGKIPSAAGILDDHVLMGAIDQAPNGLQEIITLPMVNTVGRRVMNVYRYNERKMNLELLQAVGIELEDSISISIAKLADIDPHSPGKELIAVVADTAKSTNYLMYFRLTRTNEGLLRALDPFIISDRKDEPLLLAQPPRHLLIGDLNGDSHQDLVVINPERTLVFTNFPSSP